MVYMKANWNYLNLIIMYLPNTSTEFLDLAL